MGTLFVQLSLGGITMKTPRNTISNKEWRDGLIQRLKKFKETEDLAEWMLAGLILARCAMFGHKYIMIGGLWSGNLHFYCRRCSHEVSLESSQDHQQGERHGNGNMAGTTWLESHISRVLLSIHHHRGSLCVLPLGTDVREPSREKCSKGPDEVRRSELWFAA